MTMKTVEKIYEIFILFGVGSTFSFAVQWLMLVD